MLKDVIRSDFMNARKVGDHATKDALEAIIADMLKREKSEVGHVVTDAEVIDGISKEIKVQKEVIEFCKDKAKEKAEEVSSQTTYRRRSS